MNNFPVPVLAESELPTRNQSALWASGEARESTEPLEFLGDYSRRGIHSVRFRIDTACADGQTRPVG